MFYLVDILKTQTCERLFQVKQNVKCKEEEPGYMGIFVTKEQTVRISRLLLIKENWISQVKEIRDFLSIERWNTLG